VATKNIVKTMVASLVIDDLSRKEGIVADETAVEDQVQLQRAQAEQVTPRCLLAAFEGSTHG